MEKIVVKSVMLRMDQLPSGLAYLDGLRTLEDPSLLDSTIVYQSDPLLPSSSFLLPLHSPSLIFSPYKDDWSLDGCILESTKVNDEGIEEKKKRGRGRSWTERRENESEEERKKRMERNRIRMSERRAKETEEDRKERLERAREYARSRIIRETEGERERRKEANRTRTAMRRGKMNMEKSLECSLQSLVSNQRDRIQHETDEEKERRLATAREYAAAKRRNETAGQREMRLEKNRVRMQEKRKGKKDLWRNYVNERIAIKKKLDILKTQLGEKGTEECESAKKVEDLIQRLASSTVEEERNGDDFELVPFSMDRFLNDRLPPILHSLDEVISSRSNAGLFLFGPEATYLDYGLFDELEALYRLSPSSFTLFPTLLNFIQFFHQRLSLTTLIRAAPHTSTLLTSKT